MSRSDEERVADILDAAAELSEVISVTRETFVGSTLHIRAAERLLEIVGEASNALSDGFKADRPDVAWRDITALRVLLAHHYHRIDPEQVWQIAATSVPDLATQLRNG
ncbi:MAG: HepT-like ribonuclease domain-containing protein [Solirubrobacterales bacterium]